MVLESMSKFNSFASFIWGAIADISVNSSSMDSFLSCFAVQFSLNEFNFHHMYSQLPE